MKTLSNDFMQCIVDDSAWKELTTEISWSEALLEKFQSKVDWQEVSENRNILWTIPMIQKFKNRLNWTAFSENINEMSLTEECLATFVNKWNWSKLSSNSNLKLSHALLEKYRDYWDWNEIINRWNDELYYNKGIEFYERYKDYIPAGILQQSYLWNQIINQRKSQLIGEITA